MMTENEQRTIGRLEAKIEALESQSSDIMAELKSIRATLAEAKGGWRVLMAVAGISSAVGGLVVKFLPYFANLPR